MAKYKLELESIKDNTDKKVKLFAARHGLTVNRVPRVGYAACDVHSFTGTLEQLKNAVNEYADHDQSQVSYLLSHVEEVPNVIVLKEGRNIKD